jgi:chromosomal replication initiation ATPase DnaA
MQQILEAVSEATEVPVVEIVGDRRFPRIAEARIITYWLARESKLSFPEIGYQLGRDHSTIMSGVKRVAESTRATAIASEIARRLGIHGGVVPTRVRVAVEQVA